jgi:hypothetical protein
MKAGIKKTVLIFLCLIFVTLIKAQQINIPLIEQMPNQPIPFEMRDWKEAAIGYDQFVFDFNKTGQYLPLVWLNNNTINYPGQPTFGLHTVVGTPHPQSAEAINCIPAVIGAALAGIDKSNQNGYDWVTMCQEWFNKRPEMNVYKNHWHSDMYDDWWYITMPNVFFYQLNYLYPGKGDFNNQFRIVADQFLQSVKVMGGSAAPWSVPNMNYRGWDFIKMEPYAQGVLEPEAAGAIGWILYNAYIQTGELKYRMGAEWCLEFLNGLTSNPSYELQLPYGVYAAARMNAELGTTYEIYKLLNWCFSLGYLRNWGVTTGRWGVYDVNGLVGELSPRKYAFLMNTFQHIGALVPLVRYDDRFARAIGKWVLNAANSTRLFYTKYLSDLNQDSEEWSHQYDPGSYIGHEALLQLQSGSPYATGDAINGGWGATNLTLYSSSHVGIFGGIIDTTNVSRILKLDVLKTDYYRNPAYQTFLYFNPYSEVKSVEIDLGASVFDLYDAVNNSFITFGSSGKTNFNIQPDAAVLLVLVPSGGTLEYKLRKTLVNGIIIDYNNRTVVQNYPPRIKGLAAKQSSLLPNGETNIYCTAVDSDFEILSYTWSANGSIITGTGAEITWTAPPTIGEFIIKVIVEDTNGLKDSLDITLTVAEQQNNPPVIKKIKAAPRKVDLNSETRITCEADDEDGDQLTISWESDYGSISGEGFEIIWTSPPTAGNYYVKCTVDDGSGGIATDSISIMVRDLSIRQTGNLIAFYPFNGNANDESGNSSNGLINGCTFSTDRHGTPNSALFFNGLTDNVKVANNSQLNFTNSMSINFWMKPTEIFQREAFPISHGSWENRWKVSIVNPKVRWTIRTDNPSSNGIKDLDSETGLSKDSLYNITVTYSGSDMEIFINGELDAFTSWSGQLRTTTYDLMIGQRLPNDFNYNYKGILDDIRIYDYALNLDEISDLYDIGTSLKNEEEIPLVINLFQNYPNPFNLGTNISFSLDDRRVINLTIFDILGRKIKTLFEGELERGFYSLYWDGRNDLGQFVSSGAYLCSLHVNELVIRKKLLQLK